VAAEAGAKHLAVIHIGWDPSVVTVTTLANVAGQHVGRSFTIFDGVIVASKTPGCCAVMTEGCRPIIGCMAVRAVISTGDMR